MNSGFLGGGIGPTAIKRRSGLAAPVPVAGAELANAAFDADTSWVKEAPWSIGSGVATKASTPGGAIYQAAATVGQWWIWQFDISAISGALGVLCGSAVDYVSQTTTGTKLRTWRATAGANVGLYGATGNSATVDNLAISPLTLSSLFSTCPCASANCDLSAAITRTAGTQAGLVARLDSATSPANFIIAYLDGASNVKVDKCVAGTYTNVISGAITYGSTKILRLVCSGNNVRAYYNGAQVGSTVTVSDAGITGNKNHGLFSTYASNSFAGYVAA